jgi:hypothetical protein
MLDDSGIQTALGSAVTRLLRPVVRLLLRHAVPFSAFEDIAKRVYVDVAMKEFSLPGRKPSVSRASILTGLTRKDVTHLLLAPLSDSENDGAQYNRAVRVLSAWARDPALRGPDDQPRALEIEGESGFAALVRRYSGDMPVRAVLDELERVGAVRHRDDGRVELVQRAFVPQHSVIQKLGILGIDVAELAETIEHNIHHGATDPRYQRKVMHVGIPVDVLPAFRELSAAQAQALLERLDAWLAVRDVKHADPPARADAPTARVGLGIYYFEQLGDAAVSNKV